MAHIMIEHMVNAAIRQRLIKIR